MNKETQEIDNRSVVIEQAKPEDTEAICNVLRQTWLNAYPNAKAGVTHEDIRLRIEGEHGERIPQNLERWRNNIKTTDGSIAVFVARIDSKVVGFVAPGFIDGQRRVGALYVLPKAQGKGIGSKLMQKALEWHGTSEDIYLAVASYKPKRHRFLQAVWF